MTFVAANWQLPPAACWMQLQEPDWRPAIFKGVGTGGVEVEGAVDMIEIAVRGENQCNVEWNGMAANMVILINLLKIT